jgi:hypothetical protein
MEADSLRDAAGGQARRSETGAGFCSGGATPVRSVAGLESPSSLRSRRPRGHARPAAHSTTERVENPGADNAARRQPLLTRAPERETALLVEKDARHQVLFRAVNEHIAELCTDGAEVSVSLFLCECSSEACAEALEITAAEYERVRTDGARFVVLPGHQLSDLERVIEGSSRFLVVEKLGAAAAIARASDPRHHA